MSICDVNKDNFLFEIGAITDYPLVDPCFEFKMVSADNQVVT